MLVYYIKLFLYYMILYCIIAEMVRPPILKANKPVNLMMERGNTALVGSAA